MNKHYIYLLPTKNGRYFKLGKSSIGQVRATGKLHRIYNFDFNRSLVFFADRETVYKVETELKKSIPSCKHVYGKVDGSSEIREFKYFGKALALLRDKELVEFPFYQIFGKDKSKQTSATKNNSTPDVRRIYRKINRIGRLNLSDYCILYPFNFIEYSFDCYGCLNLEFIKDYDNHYGLLQEPYIKYYTHGHVDELRVVFRLTNNNDDQVLIAELCQILCIAPTQKEKYLAIEHKQRSLNLLKELCVFDSPICFKDFINNFISKIFKF